MAAIFLSGKLEFSFSVGKDAVPDEELQKFVEDGIHWPPSHKLYFSPQDGEGLLDLPVNDRFYSPVDNYKVVENSKRNFTVSFDGCLKIPSGGSFNRYLAPLKKGTEVALLIPEIVIAGSGYGNPIFEVNQQVSLSVSKTKPPGAKFK